MGKNRGLRQRWRNREGIVARLSYHYINLIGDGIDYYRFGEMDGYRHGSCLLAGIERPQCGLLCL